jgi:hypothetical protein
MTRLILLTIGFIIGSAALMAQPNGLPWKVIGSGGSLAAQSGGTLLSGTLGQTFIGIRSVTDGNRLSQGFWLPLPSDTTSVDEYDDIAMGNDVSNFPNPFTTSTTIRFSTPLDGRVTIRVYDIVGNLVRTVAADLSITGAQDVYFDGLDGNGAPLGSGTYLYEVSGTGSDGRMLRRTQRMDILR